MMTYPPSLGAHQLLIRDFLNGPIDREKTKALLHLALATERSRCAKIARDNAKLWREFGWNTMALAIDQIAGRIENGEEPVIENGEEPAKL